MQILNNQELQAAIDALLSHFAGRTGWCQGGSPDGAAAQVLASLLREQENRVKGA